MIFVISQYKYIKILMNNIYVPMILANAPMFKNISPKNFQKTS